MKVVHVVGARPNFMKIAPIIREMSRFPDTFEQLLVHTGQHYDANMSQVFFDDLELPHADVNLGVGSGTQSWQTAKIMMDFEKVVLEHAPDWVVVVGDVNSTVACSLVCSKLGVPVAHVEAGLRSFDRSMPEEINRLVTDQLADLLLTPSSDGNENLAREGIAAEKIELVGNVMIDTLVRLLPKARSRWAGTRERFGLDRFALVTLHRPSNVDCGETLAQIIAALDEIGSDIPIVFPVHPRTRQRMIDQGLDPRSERLMLIEPVGYLEFLGLQANARFVLTDSGGVQEETTYLGVPCLTARPNTERPITISEGTNQLVASRRTDLVEAARRILAGQARAGRVPALWDGQTAVRITEIMQRFADRL